ncbi:MAG TPA: WD40 repeat domain-containing protein [Gemmataceae bacterium]|nr:WD40 repeat domain-containing protein [Gemmataceae bacterium]
MPRRRIRLTLATLCTLVLCLACPNFTDSLRGQEPHDAVGDPLPKGIVYRLGTTRLRHWVVNGLRFTPDGKQLLSVGDTDECMRWDVATGKLLGTLPFTSFPIDISRDSRLSACWDKDGAKVLEWPSGKLIHSLPAAKLERLAFCKDGKTLVGLARDNWVYRWDIIKGKELGRRQFDLAERLYFGDPPACFSPDGSTLAGVLKKDAVEKKGSGPLRFWDVATGKEIRPSITVSGTLYGCRWSPDGQRLFAMVLPYGVEIWDLATGKKVEPQQDPDVKAQKSQGIGAEVVEVTPDGQGLLLGVFGQLALYDLKTGKTTWSRPVASSVSGPGLKLSTVISFAFSPVNKTVAVGCSCGHIALLDWTTGKDVEFSAKHPGFFGDPLHFSGDGSTMLVTDAMTRKLLLVDAATGKELRRLSEHRVLAWSPDGKQLVFSTSLKKNQEIVRLVDAKSGKELWQIKAWPTHAWFSANGKVFAYWDLNDRTFHLIDASKGTHQHTFRLPPEVKEDTDTAAISHDFSRVAVKAKQAATKSNRPGWKELQVWDIAGKKQWTWEVSKDWEDGIWNVQFLPGGKHLVVDGFRDSDQTSFVCVLDIANGKLLRQFKTEGRGPYPTASPDGRYIALRGKNKSEVREVGTGRLMFEFEQKGVRSYLHDMAFSHTSRQFAYCLDDYTVEFREMRTGQLISKFHRPTYFIRQIAFAPDGHTIAVCRNDCTIWMWDPQWDVK